MGTKAATRIRQVVRLLRRHGYEVEAPEKWEEFRSSVESRALQRFLTRAAADAADVRDALSEALRDWASRGKPPRRKRGGRR